MACIGTGGPVGVLGFLLQLGSMLMSVLHVVTEEHVWFMILLQPGVVLMPVAHVAIEGHTDVHGLCSHLKPC